MVCRSMARSLPPVCSRISIENNSHPCHFLVFPTRNITSRLIQKPILEHQRSNTGTHQVLHYSKRATNQLRKYLVRLKRPLLAPASSRRVRFVHVSDTHNCHNHLRFHGTKGDVLLHTGDCVGNYRRENVHEHFKSFTKWLIEMSKVFKHVVFIAGNHDVQLDYLRSEETLKMLKESLPNNVHYLNNTSTSIMGVRIFGSSYCVSRAEEKNKRYMSNAFERDRATRKAMYEKYLVDGIDVLLTHSPPSGILCWNKKRNYMGPGDLVVLPKGWTGRIALILLPVDK